MPKAFTIQSSVLAAIGTLAIPTVKQALAKPDGFAAWLRALGEMAVAGHSRKASQCPIACYVKAVTGHDYVAVNVTGCLYKATATDEIKIVQLPDWAEELLLTVDRSSPRSHVVTAGECLRWLTGEEV